MLYHLSGERGRKAFDPQRYWYKNYSQSGKVRNPDSVPNGAKIHAVFYAAKMPKAAFYSVPRQIRRLYLDREKHGASFEMVAEVIGDIERDCVIVFEKADRSEIVAHRFSVYTFDSADFDQLPNGEFVSYRCVRPTSEQRYENAEEYLLTQGFQVIYVDDIWSIKDALVARQIKFDAEHLRVRDPLQQWAYVVYDEPFRHLRAATLDR